MIADLSYMNIEELTKDFYDFQTAGMKDSNGKFKSAVFPVFAGWILVSERRPRRMAWDK